MEVAVIQQCEGKQVLELLVGVCSQGLFAQERPDPSDDVKKKLR